MENKASKKIKLLNLLIVVLFLVSFSSDFIAGFSMGWNAMDQAPGKTENTYFAHFAVNDAPTQQINEEVAITPMVELSVVHLKNYQKPLGLSITSGILTLVALVSLVWTLVLILRFTPGVAKTGMMEYRNIKRLRKISYALGIMGFSTYANRLIDYLFLKNIDMGNFHPIIEGMPGMLIVALIIFVLAEILHIGYKLQQDQELTI